MKSGRLALVGGEPPLACFHISSCGLISSASIMRTGLGATHVSDAPTRSAGAVCPGHLSLRMPEYQPRDAFRSLASVLNWPTQSSTGVTRGARGFGKISGQYRCLQAAAGQERCPVNPMRAPGRSRAAAAQTLRSEPALAASDGLAPRSKAQSLVWVDGADSSYQSGAPGRPYRTCTACQTASTLAASWQAL